MIVQKTILVITGTPATGKTTIARKVAKLAGSTVVIRANDLVRSKRLFSSLSKDGTMIVEMSRLKREILKAIRSSSDSIVVVEGHLLCDIGIDGATAVVIREHLRVLERRMKRRGYAAAKIKKNLVSEALDYCGVNARRHYTSVFEFMGGEAAPRKIAALASGARMKQNSIELLGELTGFTMRKGWNA